jgi:glutathione peroxidase
MKLYKKYKDHGLQVLAFPCNQFMNQENKLEKEIKAHISHHFNVTFPVFSKIKVNGENTDPIYLYLKSHTPELYDPKKGLKNLPWNFAKFLVDNQGNVIRFYNPWENPSEMIPQIESMLNISTRDKK